MDNFGIMRHGENNKGTNKLTKNGIKDVKIISKKIKEFILRLGYKKIIIYHSIEMRTIITSYLLQSEMYNMLADEITELTFLNEENSLHFSKRKIKLTTSSESIFYIFVTHMPNIAFFLSTNGIIENINKDFFWSNRKIIRS